MLFAVCALFVCRQKVCFYLLDVDILILGLEMPKNIFIVAFGHSFVLLYSVIQRRPPNIQFYQKKGYFG